MPARGRLGAEEPNGPGPLALGDRGKYHDVPENVTNGLPGIRARGGVAMRARHTVAAGIVAACLWLLVSVPALAATFVYVSNAEDAEIGMYTLNADGSVLTVNVGISMPTLQNQVVYTLVYNEAL